MQWHLFYLFYTQTNSECKEENDSQKQFISNKKKRKRKKQSGKKVTHRESEKQQRCRKNKNKQFFREKNLKVSTYFFDFVFPFSNWQVEQTVHRQMASAINKLCEKERKLKKNKYIDVFFVCTGVFVCAYVCCMYSVYTQSVVNGVFILRISFITFATSPCFFFSSEIDRWIIWR